MQNVPASPILWKRSLPPGSSHRQRWWHLFGRRGLLLGLTCALLGQACHGAAPPELATLETVSPRELEAGDLITLTGAGFVEGPAELVLEGSLATPGHQRQGRDATLVLDVVATSSTRATGRLRRRHTTSLAGPHVTFVGAATLHFTSAIRPAICSSSKRSATSCRSSRTCP